MLSPMPLKIYFIYFCKINCILPCPSNILCKSVSNEFFLIRKSFPAQDNNFLSKKKKKFLCKSKIFMVKPFKDKYVAYYSAYIGCISVEFGICIFWKFCCLSQ